MDENNKDDIIEVEKVTDNEVQKVEQVNQDEENKKEEQQEVKNAEVVNEKQKNQVEEEKDRKGYCIASLVLGIVSLVLLFVSYISVPCAITAIIFGAIGIKSKNKGMANTKIRFQIGPWVMGTVALSAIKSSFPKRNIKIIALIGKGRKRFCKKDFKR